MPHVTSPPPTPAPTVIGIDDWAWRKGTSYGGIVVDLPTHRMLDLLPDQAQHRIVAWLRHHPLIQIVSRDRGGGFATAITTALPTATHIVDRWLRIIVHQAQVVAIRMARGSHGTIGA